MVSDKSMEIPGLDIRPFMWRVRGPKVRPLVSSPPPISSHFSSIPPPSLSFPPLSQPWVLRILTPPPCTYVLLQSKSSVSAWGARLLVCIGFVCDFARQGHPLQPRDGHRCPSGSARSLVVSCWVVPQRCSLPRLRLPASYVIICKA